ncbi:MAG: hypothetical protein K0S92_1736, partial [Desertimonas sp.]|nr:hypothetical protein [Desertimonas sp.]
GHSARPVVAWLDTPWPSHGAGWGGIATVHPVVL